MGYRTTKRQMHHAAMKKPLTPLPPRPPVRRNLTAADLEAIRQVIASEIARLPTVLVSTRPAQRRGGCG